MKASHYQASHLRMLFMQRQSDRILLATKCIVELLHTRFALFTYLLELTLRAACCCNFRGFF